MPEDMKGLAEGFGVAIPGLGGSTTGESGGEGALGGILNQLLGGGDSGSTTGATEGSSEPTPSGTESEPSSGEEEKKPLLDPGTLLKKLKKLF
jgi:hypothetical protein